MKAEKQLALDVLLKDIQEITGEKFFTEYRFDRKRKWRFDVAFPAVKVAIEIEGGVWNYGRHNRAAGFLKDLEKYNSAAEQGWRILRYTWDEIEKASIYEQIVSTIENREKIISYRVG